MRSPFDRYATFSVVLWVGGWGSAKRSVRVFEISEAEQAGSEAHLLWQSSARLVAFRRDPAKLSKALFVDVTEGGCFSSGGQTEAVPTLASVSFDPIAAKQVTRPPIIISHIQKLPISFLIVGLVASDENVKRADFSQVTLNEWFYARTECRTPHYT
jgi:hypothetical protein